MHHNQQAFEHDTKTPDARDWVKILADYREPCAWRSSFELGVTLGPFILIWALAWVCLSISPWLSFVLSLCNAAFLLRLFAIQHDCGHSAFFKNRTLGDWTGRVLGVLTLTPYDVWRRSHAIHHSGSGNLSRRGMGDIHTKTVAEYRCAVAPSAFAIPGLPQPDHTVRPWAGVYFPFSEPLARRVLEPGKVLGQRDGDQCGDLRCPWRDLLLRRHLAGLADLSSDLASGGNGGGLAVLCPTPVRRRALGAGCGLGYPHLGVARKLVLCAAEGVAVDQREHRHSSRASPVFAHPLLSIARSAA